MEIVKPNPQKHHRRSIRLKGYDYSQPGAYFVTICAQNREHMFGEVVGGEMRLNDAGRMVERWWLKLNDKFPNVRTDVYVIMPNHFHGIVVIVNDANTGAGTHADGGTHTGVPLRDGAGGGAGAGVGADPRVCPGAGAHADGGAHADEGAHTGVPLPTVVQWFKTMTTNEYIRGVKTLGWMPFPRRLWQRNYYEHIVRNDRALNAIRRYITNNPLRWDMDRYNPQAKGPDPVATDIWRMLQASNE